MSTAGAEIEIITISSGEDLNLTVDLSSDEDVPGGRLGYINQQSEDRVT